MMKKGQQKRKLQKGDFTKKQIRIGNIITNISLFLGIASITILYYCFVSPEYDNVLSFTLIFWIFGLIGVSCFILLYYKTLKDKVPYLRYLNMKGRNIAGSVIFAFVALPFSILYFNNRFADPKNAFEIATTVITKEKVTRSTANHYRSGYNYYLNVDYKGNRKRILIDKYLWDNVELKDRLTLHIQTGFLGFDYIKSVTH